jgi:hypothetical protein
MDLIPLPVVVAKYFQAEQAATAANPPRK